MTTESNYMPVAALRLNKGTALFVLDMTAKEIRRASVEAINGAEYYTIPPNCRFCVALNEKNADRKFVRMLTNKKGHP
jgi:hypothetical protein